VSWYGEAWTNALEAVPKAFLPDDSPGGPQIDGEAVACNDDGLSMFDRLRYRRQNG
jgi:hypothetical protein